MKEVASPEETADQDINESMIPAFPNTREINH